MATQSSSSWSILLAVAWPSASACPAAAARRDLALSHTACWLLVINQDSDEADVGVREPHHGQLRRTTVRLAAKAPAGLAFVKVRC